MERSRGLLAARRCALCAEESGVLQQEESATEEEFSVKRQILAFLKRKKVFSEKANFGQNSAKICLL